MLRQVFGLKPHQLRENFPGEMSQVTSSSLVHHIFINFRYVLAVGAEFCSFEDGKGKSENFGCSEEVCKFQSFQVHKIKLLEVQVRSENRIEGELLYWNDLLQQHELLILHTSGPVGVRKLVGDR